MNAAMRKLNETDLLSLERYSRERADFRARVMAHKRNRQLAIGPNTMWLFEDRLTVQYQVQEMLRTERIFEAEGIAEELAAYNPLIPDGRNWKATLLIEYPDPEVRRVQLERLRGIEDRCYVQVAGFDRLYAIADAIMDPPTVPLVDGGREPLQAEFGFTLATRARFKIWRFDAPRLGFGYRFAGDFSAWRLVIGEPF